MEANGVNYYKGVLLCSRPNESPSVQVEKPFCGRVTPHDAIGLVPTKKFDQHKTRKRNLPVLSNHKKWLESFKKKVSEQKQAQEENKAKEAERIQKIKEEGYRMREEQKKSLAASVENKSTLTEASPEPFVEKKRQAKKGQKPGWAKSKEEREFEEQKEVDELLDFFDNDDVKDYLADEEVSKMLRDLKERISEMKKEGNDDNMGNWKKKQAERIQEARAQNQGDKDDIMSRISRNSEAQSVASQKAAERVQELEKKKEEKEWDKYTATDKRSQASLDGQIAKNVADEVLRNYPALKHHSNQSIRKLLEKQAREQISQ